MSNPTEDQPQADQSNQQEVAATAASRPGTTTASKPATARSGGERPKTPTDNAKSADAIVADLDFDKQLRQNLTTFIPLLIVSLLILGGGAGLSAKAAVDILDSAKTDNKIYQAIKNGSVPKTDFFLIGTILAGFGIFVLMVVTVMFLDKRERILNRRKIIEDEARLQKLKAKPKNIFDVLLNAARSKQQQPQPES